MRRLDKDGVILAFLAGGFAMMAIEVRDLHRDALGEHWQAWIPITYGAIACLASLSAMAARTKLRLISGIILALGLIVGPVGFYQHTEGDFTQVMRLLARDSVTAYADDGEGDARDERRSEGEEQKPPLAPLAITGLAAIGAATIFLKRHGSDA